MNIINSDNLHLINSIIEGNLNLWVLRVMYPNTYINIESSDDSNYILESTEFIQYRLHLANLIAEIILQHPTCNYIWYNQKAQQLRWSVIEQSIINVPNYSLIIYTNKTIEFIREIKLNRILNEDSLC